MPGGRPSKIDQVARTRDDGSHVTVGEQLVERVQLGLDLQTAADSAGIDRSTLHRWRLEGSRLRAQHAQGKLPRPTPHQRSMIEFCNALERAEAEAEANRLAIIQRAATGGARVTKTTEKVAVQADGTTRVVERTTTTETLRPEWTAAAWWLERRRGYVKRYELTGADGAPLVPPAEAARSLADSLREYLQGVDDGKAAAKAEAEAGT